MKRPGVRTFLPVLALLLAAAPLAAKEMMITVRRDFGLTETPEIELHYTRSAPFTVRVYRPKDMKEFVASQADLRRAWREPAVEWNAAKFLFSGLNKTRLDLDWLRTGADFELRKRLRDEFGGGSWSPTPTRLSEGPAKIVAGPNAFDLLNEFSFEPDAGDVPRADGERRAPMRARLARRASAFPAGCGATSTSSIRGSGRISGSRPTG